MDQNPAMPGSNPSDPNHQPANAGMGTDAKNPASATNLMPDWVKNNPAVVAGPNGSVVDSAASPKKKRTGLIALIIALLILLLGFGSFAAWYFLYYNNPDKVAYDAINGFLQQKTVVTNGLVTSRGKFNGGEVMVMMNLSNRTNGADGESVVSIKINILDENGDSVSEHDYEVELGGIVMEDGVIYLRVNKLVDAIDLFLEDTGSSVEMLDEDTLALYNLLEQVDGEWWRISVPEVIDGIIDDSEVANSAKDAFSCLNKVMHDNVNSKIAAIYKDNRFVNIEAKKDGATGGGYTEYDVTLDYDKFADFINATTDSELASEAEACLRKVAGDSTNFDKTYTDADAVRNAMGQTRFTMLVSNFGHNLKAINMSVDDDLELDAGFTFEHPVVTIDAPTNYRPISELMDLIVDSIVGILMPGYDDGGLYYDEETGDWWLYEEGFDYDEFEEV